MATSKTVLMSLVVFVAMVLIAGFAWTAGSNRNKRRAASPKAQPESTADVGEDRLICTTPTTRRRSALDSSTTQWDRADTREVTKGTSP
jgi:cytoskeletal protein RodZ